MRSCATVATLEIRQRNAAGLCAAALIAAEFLLLICHGYEHRGPPEVSQLHLRTHKANVQSKKNIEGVPRPTQLKCWAPIPSGT